MSSDAENCPVNIDVPESVAKTFKLESLLETLHVRTRFENPMPTHLLPGSQFCEFVKSRSADPRSSLPAPEVSRKTCFRARFTTLAGVLVPVFPGCCLQ
jgi:hypothetical protein